MKVICIDASNKPDKIPLEEWVEEGVVYTVKRIVSLNVQDAFGYELEEIFLSEKCFPYECYAAERFLPIITSISADELSRLISETEASSENSNLSSLE